MNDLVNLRFLEKVQSSNCCQLSPLIDEPTYCYVTRVMLLTAVIDRLEIVDKYFGTRGIHVEKPLHSGFDRFSQQLNCSSGTLISEHSMLALFKPFADLERYSHACELARSQRGTGMHELVGSRGNEIYRAQPTICLDCVRDDLKRMHFSYYRRSHQVSAVSHCAIHETPLTLCCSTCGTSFSHWDIPDLKCQHCGEKLAQSVDEPESVPDIAARIRLSKVIAAVFAGKVVEADVGIRMAVLQSQTEQRVKTRSGVIGDNLATYLNRMFGTSFLASLSLTTHSAPTLGWPALFLHGRFMVHDPIANSLLVAALFDSVDDYNNAINTWRASHGDSGIKPKPLIAAGNITFSMLRDALRFPTIKSVTQKYGGKSVYLKKWIAAYPGLSERRASLQLRLKLRTYKNEIKVLLIEQPGLSRTQASKKLNSAFACVHRFDPHWIQQTLPVQKVLSGAVALARNKSTDLRDDEISDQLSKAVKMELAVKGRPIRLTPPKVFALTGLSMKPEEIRKRFPNTFARAFHLCEDMESYCRRSLDWAAWSLERQYGVCDNLTELFVHARVGLKFVKPLEGYARSLLNTKNSVLVG